MAYRNVTIPALADPATALLTEIEGTMNDHTGQWEFVEEVTISTIAYRIWRNRGTGVTNPNSFGSDYHIALWKFNATSIRIRTFEVWDATNKKMIRPTRGTSTATAPNANGSFGDETNGYTVDNTYAIMNGISGLPTTGLDCFIRATKDQLNVYIKHGTTDEGFTVGVFESLLTASPAEPFPLFMTRSNDGSIWTSVTGGLSRHPVVTAANAFNAGMGSFQSSLSPLVGGIGSTAVDKMHGDSILVGRPLVQMAGSDPTGQGQYRGQMIDCVVLSTSGGSTRNGDTVTLGADVYVRCMSATISSTVIWIKRDAT